MGPLGHLGITDLGVEPIGAACQGQHHRDSSRECLPEREVRLSAEPGKLYIQLYIECYTLQLYDLQL